MSNASNGRKVIVEATADAAAAMVAELWKIVICESVQARGSCRLALAGGTTPHGLYQQLARTTVAGGDVPWPSVEVFFSDERDVPHDHVESNYRMAQRALLDHIPVPPSQVHPMPADAADLAAASAEYEQVIRRLVPAGSNGVPRFDLILLGVGADGHVGSLFPRSQGVEENEKLITAHFVAVLGRNRMTFTYPLINAARNVVLFVTGDDKAAAVARMLSGQEKDKRLLPVVGVVPTEGQLFVVLDKAAASRIDLK